MKSERADLLARILEKARTQNSSARNPFSAYVGRRKRAAGTSCAELIRRCYSHKILGLRRQDSHAK